MCALFADAIGATTGFWKLRYRAAARKSRSFCSGGKLQGLSGVYIVEVYSFLQLANFVSFDKVFSTKLIEIDNIYNSIRDNLLELEEVDG